MASVNKVILLGRLGRDPEMGQTTSATSVARLAVATSRTRKDQSGNRTEETEWHNVVLFGRQAETAKQYLTKGSEVYIEGRLRTRSYEKDGVKRYSTEIIAEQMQLGAKAHGNPPAPKQTPAQQQAFGDDEDVPF
ncbi:single-stranded DNA-binding protein [Mesosutterella sp. AGMB02718]|uniref:Single-stranded DNA-binding protein n=1 Tax=Mesosutterella faecium TaxID=2925194 RepID=A0ABT7ITE8_9BURK|nr:single-stranded DNA-binding protein [Mesosutterella sp. AGMB02718]MDL2060334.1 single-stranded DNA-binding protein [Mesosutterella sp. AGMB02718]MDL2060557.1 single-stranded DNA-binding protein [Mesosutterella sp. AGMB02718]